MINSPRIQSKIVVVPWSGCWVWIGELNRNGYGRVSVEGAKLMVHRVVYQLLVGEIPEERPILDHLCRVRCCCNPDHLEPVTVRENTLRGEAKLIQPGTNRPPR